MTSKEKRIIGRVERVSFPVMGLQTYARIDTGAKTSSIHSALAEETNEGLRVCFFDDPTEHVFPHYKKTVITSSMGHKEVRYKVKLSVVMKKRRVLTSFTLANRSTQVYPVLIGRNTLMRKFIVDVARGTPLKDEESRRSESLQALIIEEKQV